MVVTGGTGVELRWLVVEQLVQAKLDSRLFSVRRNFRIKYLLFDAQVGKVAREPPDDRNEV